MIRWNQPFYDQYRDDEGEPLGYRSSGADFPKNRIEGSDPDPTLEQLHHQAEQISTALADHVYVCDTQSRHLALLTALVHASPTELTSPNGRVLTYGPLQVLVCGEPASLKTTVAAGITRLVGLAEIASADTATRAGLLYRIAAREVVPGLLPRNHGGMVVLDELHKIRPQEIRTATWARSQGVLNVEGRSRAKLPMQSRFLCLANLRPAGGLSGAAHRSVSLDDLDSRGIRGAGFLDPEDLRRFDLVMITARAPVQTCTDRPDPSDAHRLSAEAIVQRLRSAWDHDREGATVMVWAPGTPELAERLSGQLRAEFEYPPLPVFGPDTQDTLLRVAAAAARLMPSSTAPVWTVTHGHVRWAAFFLYANYHLPGNGLAELAAETRRQNTVADDSSERLFRTLQGDIPELLSLCRFVSHHDQFTTADLAMHLGVSVRTAASRVRILKQAGLLSSHGRAGLAASPQLQNLARNFTAAEDPLQSPEPTAVA